MLFTLSKPFQKTMNSESVKEIDIDFDKLTAKDYVDSFSNQDGNELELIAYGKLGFLQSKNLIAKTIGCIPEMLDEMPLEDYREIEKECFAWFFANINQPKDVEMLDFSRMSVKDYLAIRSRNSIQETTIGTMAGAKTREMLISFMTKKKTEELEAMTIKDYLLLDIQCASFFSTLG